MCGIIGTIGKIPKKEEFEKARDVLSHRGPDDFGAYYNEKDGVALGHRRLSIIDLSLAGHQPFLSNDGRYAVVFNGEIYNYLELKKELENFYDFKTKTDTEVLLASYIKWGKDCLQKFNGMFAFAIWDEEKKELFCARDRLGVKPFYYSSINSEQVFCFSSEIKGLLALEIKPEPNDKIIYDYLAYGLYDHSNETFFNKILKLPAGHYLVYKNNKLDIFKYWDLADIKKAPSKISLIEAKEKFLELLSDSIKLRLRSDVKVGVNLSSGLDSATLLFFAEKITGRNLDIFSMCSVEEEYDECSLIKNFLDEKQKNKWHRSCLKPEEVMELIVQLIESQDEPYGGIPTIAYHQLAGLEKDKGVTVVLEGQGGDEILAGYKYYQPEFIENMMKEKQGFKYSQDMSTQINTYVLKDSFLKKEFHNFIYRRPFKSELLNAQYRDIVYSKLPRVLRFNDRMSMVFGREWRQPYLDYRIVEMCFFLPDELKINNGVQKFLLRETMKEIVPSDAGQRPKKTFGAIQTPWFRKYLKDYIIEILNSESFGQRPYWNQEKVLEEANKFFNGEGDNSFFIWQWVNLELWLRKYIDSAQQD
ncbi:asparagine synthase (glutamine-hydrolyzing) [Patescibacteria group bacterium]|nr:asparagine synthase (glutamine-hydrolyzing) [Patescibacteria group bacterium]